MKAVQDIADIFSMLHDGTISSWDGDNTLLTIAVDCQYLAERIHNSFDRFYVELREIGELSLETWPNPFELPRQTFTSPRDIFKAELEILSAEIQQDVVIISCNQSDPNYDYCGGDLTLRCNGIRVFDQNKNEITIDALNGICKSYWDDWANKWNPDVE